MPKVPPWRRGLGGLKENQMEDKNSYYDKSLKKYARELRNNSTFGEVILWSKVLKSKGTGYQFNRQYAMKIDELKIIVDFICRPLKLIIEIDGYSHNDKFKEDAARDEKLKSNGYKVLRFSEQIIKFDIDNVTREIEEIIKEIEENQ